MAIEKGDIRTSVNYEVMAKKPLDARELKPTKASLFDKESWSYDGDNVYIQEGLKVFVQDEKKLYLLVDETKYDTEEGWEVIATGELAEMEQVVVIDSLDSLLTDAALSANQGRILKARIEEVAGEATKIYSIKGSTKYAELPMTGNKVGDVYNITDDFTLGGVSYPAGTNVVWDGSNWDALGGSIDLSSYAKTSEVTAMVQTETQRARGAEARLQNDVTTIRTDVANKVDKVSGKGLSTEDFTSALKEKLDELENYDDEDIRNDIESLQTQLDTLTNSDDLEEVIAKYEELKAFLEGLGNDEYGAFIEEISKRIAVLEASLKTTNSRIDNVTEEVERLETDKQDALTSGVNIVTINGQSLLGSGNIDLGTGGGGNANVLVINSNKDFEVVNTESTIVTINDGNTTYAKVKEAVDNGYSIVLKEPRGNISYAVRADYVSDRILVYFSKSIGELIYDIVLWVGLNDSLTCIISKNGLLEVDTELSETSENAIANSTVSRALAEKQDMLMNGINIKTINGQNVLGRGNIEIEGGTGGGITEETEVYIGEEAPTDDGAKLWIDPTGTPSQPSDYATKEYVDNAIYNVLNSSF